MTLGRIIFWSSLIICIGLIGYGGFQSVNFDRKIEVSQEKMSQQLNSYRALPWISRDGAFRIENIYVDFVPNTFILNVLGNGVNHKYDIVLELTDNFVLKNHQIQFLINPKNIIVRKGVTKDLIGNSLANQYIDEFFSRHAFPIIEEFPRAFHLSTEVTISENSITFKTVDFVYYPIFSLMLAVGIFGFVLILIIK